LPKIFGTSTNQMSETKTTWCQTESEAPKIGDKCPECQKGEVKRSKFGLGWCPECRHNWKLSKWAKPKQEEPDPLVFIMDEIKSINERIDNLAEYLRDNLADIKRHAENADRNTDQDVKSFKKVENGETEKSISK